MIELFPYISNETRQEVEKMWNLAKQMDSVNASKFLNAYTNLFTINHTENEVDFLHFYINLQMEMMKE